MRKYLYATLAGALTLFAVGGAYAYLIEIPFWLGLWHELPLRQLEESPLFFTIGYVVLKLFQAFIMSYLHEKVPRCGSSLWVKSWRFALFVWFLFYPTMLGFLYLGTEISPVLLGSWGLSGLLEVFVTSFVIIPILYHYPAPNLSCQISK